MQKLGTIFCFVCLITLNAESSAIDIHSQADAVIDSSTQISAVEANEAMQTSTSQIDSGLISRTWLLGIMLSSGNKIVHNDVNISILSTYPEKIYATDAGVSAVVGGIFRFRKRHAIRYAFLLGFARLSLYDVQSEGDKKKNALDQSNGLRYSFNLGYEWAFYQGKVISWNTFLGLDYGYSYFKKSNRSIYNQEIFPQLALGLAIQKKHYVEILIGTPFVLSMKVRVANERYKIPTHFDYLRSGIQYQYRF